VLHDYFEGTLDPEMRALVERHFQDCPDCEAFSDTYEVLMQLTGELACDDIPDEVQRRVQKAIQEHAHARRHITEGRRELLQ
jgi:predicted anti-sigma-YlaC factor YlaD